MDTDEHKEISRLRHISMTVCLVFLWLTHISSSSEDLGEDHSGQTVSAVVQCGYSEFQHSILVLHRAEIQQAANTHNKCRHYVREFCDRCIFSTIKCVLFIQARISCRVFSVHSPLKQATFLQQFDSLWVCRECSQEEEIVLAERG